MGSQIDLCTLGFYEDSYSYSKVIYLFTNLFSRFFYANWC
jgi:hypothetical protein